MKNEDVLLGIIVLVFSLFGIFGSLELISGQSRVSPSFYPTLLFSGLGICGILLIFKGLRANHRNFPKFNLKKLLPILTLFILYVFLLKSIGYILSTIIFIISTMFLLGVRNKWQLIGIPISTSLVIYITFVYGFNIILP